VVKRGRVEEKGRADEYRGKEMEQGGKEGKGRETGGWEERIGLSLQLGTLDLAVDEGGNGEGYEGELGLGRPGTSFST